MSLIWRGPGPSPCVSQSSHSLSSSPALAIMAGPQPTASVYSNLWGTVQFCIQLARKQPFRQFVLSPSSKMEGFLISTFTFQHTPVHLHEWHCRAAGRGTGCICQGVEHSMWALDTGLALTMISSYRSGPEKNLTFETAKSPWLLTAMEQEYQESEESPGQQNLPFVGV